MSDEIERVSKEDFLQLQNFNLQVQNTMLERERFVSELWRKYNLNPDKDSIGGDGRILRDTLPKNVEPISKAG